MAVRDDPEKELKAEPALQSLSATLRHLKLSFLMTLTVVSSVGGQERSQQSGSLSGIVRDTTGQPLALVHLTVALDTPRNTLTDSTGAFYFHQLPKGIHRVLFRRLGYVPAEFQVLVLEGTTRRLVVELIAAPLRMDTVTVAGGVTNYPALERTGFFDRMRMRQEGAGVGMFLTPEDVDRVRALTKTTHMLETAGVRLIQVERGLSLWPVGAANIILRASPPMIGPCQMAVFIDGIEIDFGRYYEQSGGPGLDGFVLPQEVRAIEIYRSASGTPVQFQSVRNALCGSIVIWTKSG